MSHTIAAVSTSSQVSAIGILRLSGNESAEIAGKVFQRNNGAPLSDAPDRKLVLGVLRDREGAASGDKSEDLPCAIGCLLLRRKGAPEVVAGGFSVRPYLLRPSFSCCCEPLRTDFFTVG